MSSDDYGSDYDPAPDPSEAISEFIKAMVYYKTPVELIQEAVKSHNISTDKHFSFHLENTDEMPLSPRDFRSLRDLAEQAFGKESFQIEDESGFETGLHVRIHDVFFNEVREAIRQCMISSYQIAHATVVAHTPSAPPPPKPLNQIKVLLNTHRINNFIQYLHPDGHNSDPKHDSLRSYAEDIVSHVNALQDAGSSAEQSNALERLILNAEPARRWLKSEQDGLLLLKEKAEATNNSDFEGEESTEMLSWLDKILAALDVEAIRQEMEAHKNQARRRPRR